MQTASNCTKHPQKRSTAAAAVHRMVVASASLVVGVAVVWVLVRAWVAAQASVAAPGPASNDELLALAAASLALALAAWLGVGTALEVLSHAPGHVGRLARVGADRLTPVLARRVAAFVLGVGVGVAGGPTQAVAQPRPSATAASVADPGFVPTRPGPEVSVAPPGFTPPTDVIPPPPTPPAPGFTPTAPRVRPQPDPALLGGRSVPAPGREVVVHRGDTLWAIAARHLGPGASDAEIAAAWPTWFAHNRRLIGDDPDLLLPGQVLLVPDDHESAGAPR